MPQANLAAKEKKYIIPKNSDFDEKTHKEADFIMREMDRVVRWKKIHDFLRKNNKKARKEQDKVAEDCQVVREEGWFKKDKSKVMGLRFGVSLPPMVYNAIVQSDRLIDGHSELADPDKESYSELSGSNQIVRDLAKAFPQYKVTK
ncbi:hypothetical protein KC963_01905 [Candidatus Saccharibacteria bacterium]|nr:hypothetical protein [Candidatus Saccharibacteria bacterium]